MMENIKMIAIDIDGTLVNSKKQVTLRVKQAIKMAKEKKIKVVICTGRPLTGVKALLQELELDAQDDQYVVCFGGAATYTTSGELIDERPISYEDYIDLEALARKLRLHFHAVSEDRLYTADRNIGDYTLYEANLVSMGISYRTPEEMRNIKLIKSMYVDEPEVLDAAIKGATKVIVGLGGTGTTDAGIGLMSVLGAKFYDSYHQLLPAVIGSLALIDHVDLSNIATKNVQLIACTDVDSYLTGASGAVQMFGPQKGLTELDLKHFELWFQHFSQLVDPTYQGRLAGDGAAGGIGFALRLLGATTMPGFQLMSHVAQLDDKIAAADIVITGEGQLDQQSLHGKLPVQVAQRAQRFHKPCLCVAGNIKLTVPEHRQPVLQRLSL